MPPGTWAHLVSWGGPDLWATWPRKEEQRALAMAAQEPLLHEISNYVSA